MTRNEFIQLAKKTQIILVIDRLVFDGIFTTMIDIHLNLKKLDIDSAIVILIHEFGQSYKIINRIMATIPLSLSEMHIIKYTEAVGVHVHTAIVSFGAMKNFDHYSVIPDNRLIVLGAGTIIRDALINNSKGINYTISLDKITNLYVLGNACHQKYFENINYKVYKQKFAKIRLEYLQDKFKPDIIPPPRIFYQAARETRRDDASCASIDELKASKMIYQRWNEIIPGVYNENIGKLIFEFRWLNRPVYYSPVNKSHADGLTEYLALFEVDDTIEQDLTFTKDDVNNLLVGLTHDDILVKTIFE